MPPDSCLIFDPTGPAGLCAGFAQNLIAGFIGIIFDVFILSAAIAGGLKYYSDWSLRKIRRKAAQVLWSAAMSGVVAELKIRDARANGNELSKEELLQLCTLSRFSFHNIVNFTYDHSAILPKEAFNYAMELRANGEFGIALLDAIEEYTQTADESMPPIGSYGIRFFQSNLDGFIRFDEVVSLSNIGSFMVFTILPVCKILRVEKAPDGMLQKLLDYYSDRSDVMNEPAANADGAA